MSTYYYKRWWIETSSGTYLPESGYHYETHRIFNQAIEDEWGTDATVTSYWNEVHSGASGALTYGADITISGDYVASSYFFFYASSYTLPDPTVASVADFGGIDLAKSDKGG